MYISIRLNYVAKQESMLLQLYTGYVVNYDLLFFDITINLVTKLYKTPNKKLHTKSTNLKDI